MTDGGEQGGRAIPVLNIGAMNGEADEQAGGVGDNVAFASLDLLSGIIARNTAAFRGFDALAVDDAGRRTGLAAHRFPGRHDKMKTEEHTSELQSLMRISYAVFCLKKKNNTTNQQHKQTIARPTYLHRPLTPHAERTHSTDTGLHARKQCAATNDTTAPQN